MRPHPEQSAPLVRDQGRETGAPDGRRAPWSSFAPPNTEPWDAEDAPRRRTSAQVLVDQLGHLEHRDLLLAAEDGLQLVVGVDHPPLLGVLEIVLADVGPELLDHLGAGNRLVADDLRQFLGRVQLLHEGGVWLALRSRRLLRRLLRGLLGGHSVGFSLPLCQGMLYGSSSSRWLRFNEAKGVRISGFRGENTRGTRFPLWKSWEPPLTWTS